MDTVVGLLALLVPLLAVVFFLMSKGGAPRELIPASPAAGPSWQPPSPGPAVPDQGAAATAAWLASIARSDPGFNEVAFLGWAQAAFTQLQKAWSDRDVTEAQAYLSLPLYATWKSQMQSLVQGHTLRMRANTQLTGAAIVEALQQGGMDAITVQFDGVSAEYDVDDRTNQIVDSGGWGHPFRECWTFMRKTGTKTLASGGVLAHMCPRCGGPISLNEVGECQYCHSVITNGDFDWVVSTITTPPVYVMEGGAPVSYVDGFRTT